MRNPPPYCGCKYNRILSTKQNPYIVVHISNIWIQEGSSLEAYPYQSGRLPEDTHFEGTMLWCRCGPSDSWTAGCKLSQRAPDWERLMQPPSLNPLFSLSPGLTYRHEWGLAPSHRTQRRTIDSKMTSLVIDEMRLMGEMRPATSESGISSWCIVSLFKYISYMANNVLCAPFDRAQTLLRWKPNLSNCQYSTTKKHSDLVQGIDSDSLHTLSPWVTHDWDYWWVTYYLINDELISFQLAHSFPILSPVNISQVVAVNENVFSVNLPGKKKI